MAEKQELVVALGKGVTSLCDINGVGHRSLILMMVPPEHDLLNQVKRQGNS